MGESKRTGFLTTIAILLVILAIMDFLKPFKLEGPTTGLVFLGIRRSGIANAILGPLIGLVLITYAAGIWRMRRYAMTLGWTYAVYVILNLILYVARNPTPQDPNEQIFGIVYSIVAITLTLGTAYMLTRRRAKLT